MRQTRIQDTGGPSVKGTKTTFECEKYVAACAASGQTPLPVATSARSSGNVPADGPRRIDRAHRGQACPHEIGESQQRFDNHYVDRPEWERARARPAT